MSKKDKKKLIHRFIEFAFVRDIDVLDYKILADRFVDEEDDEEEESLQIHIDNAFKRLNISWQIKNKFVG